MGQRVLVGGTGYDLPAAPVLVGGTKYDIIKGRTLIGGTGYDVPLGSSLFEFLNMMAVASLVATAARNSPVYGYAYVSVSSYPCWVLSFCDGEFAFTKYTDSATRQVIYQSSAIKGNSCLTASTGRVYYSDTGAYGYSTQVYGAMLFVFQFPSYAETQVDNIISSIRKKTGAGKNASTNGAVELSGVTSEPVFAATSSGSTAILGLSAPIGTVIYSNWEQNPSLVRVTETNSIRLSGNGSTDYNVYGGSIITLQ